MTVPTTVDAGSSLSKYLEGDDGDCDLARALLQAFAQAPIRQAAFCRCRPHRVSADAAKASTSARPPSIHRR